MEKFLALATIISVLSTGFCSSCSNLEVVSKSYTTVDATIVANIAYIAEFSVKCGSGQVGNLYAELNGNLAPVSTLAPNQYQFSWTELPKKAPSGDILVRLFDEDGYAAYRKALRAGDDVSALRPLFNVLVNHSGTYTGPWFKSEFVATIISLVLAYVAVISKSKLLA